MLKGFWKLTWVEMKVFAREPMGLFGTLFVPVLMFLVLGGTFGQGDNPAAIEDAPFNIAILAALLISITALSSLVAIISIYREGGILKRLRSTPLSPVTILGAHVFIKLVFTVIGLALLVLAGRQVLPGAIDVNLPSFTLAILLSTLSILSLGFILASVVPTSRFARPISAAVIYPMLVLSGLFFPLDVLPSPLRVFAAILPTTHAVTLLQSIWSGAGWHMGSTAALLLIFVALTMLSTRVFRWE